jgi:hypothetical protein
MAGERGDKDLIMEEETIKNNNLKGQGQNKGTRSNIY